MTTSELPTQGKLGERIAPGPLTERDSGLALGIDCGTSGLRLIALDAAGQVQATVSQPWAANQQADPAHWHTTLWTSLAALPTTVKARLRAIAIDGTSGTILRCDRLGQPLGAPWMYHQVANQMALAEVQRVAPADHRVVSSGSTLAKVLQWRQLAREAHRFPSAGSDRLYLLHQADWLGFLLHGQLGVTDYHNALKLGGDPVTLTYPDWLMTLDIAPALPRILAPGTPIAPVQPAIASELGLPDPCWVMAGTTDSIAAFLAAGVSQPGEAVTSLGSTLAIKLLSRQRVEDRRYGVYSHRLGAAWLVGGASNSGGAVLRQFFGDRELATLSAQIDPTQPSRYDYYPLLEPGERFPIADPHYPPRLEPRPADPAMFLQGLLEGMARIEALGYRRLAELGADPLVAVQTAGGGSQNPTWTAIRSRLLGVPVSQAAQPEAAIGAARLAQGLASLSPAHAPVRSELDAAPRRRSSQNRLG